MRKGLVADGFADVVVGAGGEARVYSGLTGGLLETFFTLDRKFTDGDLGYAVSDVGDLNGDGRDDVLVGAPAYFNFDTPFPGGSAFVFTVPASAF